MSPTEMIFATGEKDDPREVTYQAQYPSIGLSFSSNGSSCSFEIADLDWLRGCLEKIAQEREVANA